jgi:hypothetical protein
LSELVFFVSSKMYLDGISARYSGHAQWTLPLPISPSAETFINAVLIIGTLSPKIPIMKLAFGRLRKHFYYIFIVMIFFSLFYKKWSVLLICIFYTSECITQCFSIVFSNVPEKLRYVSCKTKQGCLCLSRSLSHPPPPGSLQLYCAGVCVCCVCFVCVCVRARVDECLNFHSILLRRHCCN